MGVNLLKYKQRILWFLLFLTSLFVLVVMIFNPLEVSRIKRDEIRVKDLESLKSEINKFEKTQRDYFLCSNLVSKFCSGRSNDTKNVDWVKIGSLNFKLPSDPLNNPSFHYTYCSDGKNWEISTRLESNRYRKKMSSDFGNENQLGSNPISAKYEIGTNLTLIGPKGGCIY